MSKTIVKDWIKKLMFPKTIKDALIEILQNSETPENWQTNISDLIRKLKDLYCYDMFHSNWHSIHCECDECLKLEFGE